MNGNVILLLPVLFPVAAGLLVAFLPVLRNKGSRRVFVVGSLLCELVFTGVCAFAVKGELTLVRLSSELTIYLHVDKLAALFAALVAVMWLLSGLFSQEYMNHEGHHERYYAFLLLSEGALIALCFAGNYLTLYLGFEFMTLLTAPLVIHSQTEAAQKAGFKYLFYSIFGACLGLLGFFFLYVYGTSTVFTPGGVLDMTKVAGHEGGILLVTFLAVVGFGAKAGMFPLHAWLPTAHPEAPAGASAVLSGVITKAGVLSIIRVVYYQVGVDFLRGTWVQYAWLGLALVTVFLGSMLAYKEKIFKKRLAYSTVSQVSYVLFGLALMNPVALVGALLHVVCHSVIKDALFFTAGAVIYKTGKKDVRDLRGIGKEMPCVFWCFTIASLGLIGIPPLGGFVSKWYLAMGSLESGIGLIRWLGPAVLLASALLTAGYLFSITIRAFFPGADYDYTSLRKCEPTGWITLPLIVLAVLTVIIGVYPKPLLDLVSVITAELM